MMGKSPNSTAQDILITAMYSEYQKEECIFFLATVAIPCTEKLPDALNVILNR